MIDFLVGIVQELVATFVALLIAWWLIKWAAGWGIRYKARAEEIAKRWEFKLPEDLVLYPAGSPSALARLAYDSSSCELRYATLNRTGITLVAVPDLETRTALARWSFAEALKRGAAVPVLIDGDRMPDQPSLADLISNAEPNLWANGMVRRLVPPVLRPQAVGFLMDRLIGDLKIIVTNAEALDSRAVEELASYAKSYSARLLFVTDIPAEAAASEYSLADALEGDATTCFMLGHGNVPPLSSAEYAVDLFIKWGRLVPGEVRRGAGFENGTGSLIWRQSSKGQRAYWARVQRNSSGAIRFLPGVDGRDKNTVEKLLDVIQAYDKTQSKDRSALDMWHIAAPGNTPDSAQPEGSTFRQVYETEFKKRSRLQQERG
jgi:hypothetical protein